MAACELGPDTLDEIALLAEARHLGVLLGAGASVGAGLPGWEDLALGLLQTAGAVGDADTGRAFLSKQDPALAAEAAKAASDNWPSLVHGALYGDNTDNVFPAALHLAAANLAVTRSSTLLTLNLDDLLEEALRGALTEVESEAVVRSRAAAAPRAKPGEHEVHHLHGLVPREGKSSNIVLTLSDFNELGAKSHPWQGAALGETMSQGPLVLAGTTYRDADIRQWLHAIGQEVGDAKPSVFALVAREGLALTRKQFDDVAEAVRQQWTAVGIKAVLVQDHADSAQILREICATEEANYQSPRERAALFWERTVSEFDLLQAEHSALLDADRRSLPSPNTENSDLTLWLSDGTANLVRWASHDRLYRRPEKLRRVPMGYDSAWVSARCVARNEVLVEQVHQPGDGSNRWQTVIAAPLTLSLTGGPDLVCGALSAAIASKPGPSEEVEWRTTLADLVEEWAKRLVHT